MLRKGSALTALAVAGTVFAALPYLGVGPDTSPTAHTYIERRYGNIGVGLAVWWLTAMVLLLIVAVALLIYTISSPGDRPR